MGIVFKQNSTGAVVCSKSVPPEGISEVTSLDGKQVFYYNKDLHASGDRRALMEVGSAMSRATAFIPTDRRMDTWPTKVIKTEKAMKEEAYYKNYDKNFNDEQMCKRCRAFLFKGITFCTRCKSVVENSDDPNNWTALRNKERIDFANARLSELLWKANIHCRSLNKPFGDKLKRAKGMDIFNRSVKKGVKTIVDGERQVKKWKSCEERWKTDITFRRRMMETNGYSLNDIRQFDIWGNEPKRPAINMTRQERQAKFGKHSKWKLTQARAGGSDTLATSLYPPQFQQEATPATQPKKVVLKEWTSWQGERKQQPPWQEEKKQQQSWQESSWKDLPWQEKLWKKEGVWAEDWHENQPSNTPGSSSTSWQQNTKHSPPWKKEESQQKRRR